MVQHSQSKKEDLLACETRTHVSTFLAALCDDSGFTPYYACACKRVFTQRLGYWNKAAGIENDGRLVDSIANTGWGWGWYWCFPPLVKSHLKSRCLCR